MRVKRALYYTLYCIYIFFRQIAPFMNGAICLLIKDAFARALLCVRPCCLLDLPISHAHDHMMMMMRALLCLTAPLQYVFFRQISTDHERCYLPKKDVCLALYVCSKKVHDALGRRNIYVMW